MPSETANEFVSEFVAEPAQWHFLESKAKVRGYGGALSDGRREDPDAL